VLRGAVVAVQPAESQRPLAGDLPREQRGRLAGPHAAAARADVDLDVRVDGRAHVARRVRERCDRARVVHQHADPRLPRQRREAQELRGRDDLVGDEHVHDAGLDERRGLVDLLAADAHRAARDLRLRDRGRFVRLRVRPQPEAAGGDLARHRVDIALERVEVEHQRGRLDRGDRVAGACGGSLHRRRSGLASSGHRRRTAAGLGGERAIVAHPARRRSAPAARRDPVASCHCGAGCPGLAPRARKPPPSNPAAPTRVERGRLAR